MSINFRSNLVRLVSRPTVSFCGLILAVLFTFSGCATTDDNPAAAAVAKPAHSEIITLREGDTVKIDFPGSANLDTTQQIRRDGKISLQLVGEVQASGLTPEELQDSLIKLYAPQIASKEITVSVESSTFPVFVTGAVVRPGKVLSDHPITALEAIMESGGFDYATANMRSVKIIRNENGVMKHYTVNLKRVLDGDKDQVLFYLKPQDIIYVSERFELF
jgi:polysaccharide biosynthesis/export protein